MVIVVNGSRWWLSPVEAVKSVGNRWHVQMEVCDS